MGYELDMIVVDNWTQKKGKPMSGYQSVIAHVDLCKCGDEFHSILTKKENLNKSVIKEIETFERLHEECFNKVTGDYSDDLLAMSERDRNRYLKPYYKLEKELSKKLPYIYWEDGGNKQMFSDGYGTPLMQATVDEVLDILNKSIAKSIVRGEEPYRRFLMAKALLESVKATFSHAAVIMFGH